MTRSGLMMATVAAFALAGCATTPAASGPGGAVSFPLRVDAGDAFLVRYDLQAQGSTMGQEQSFNMTYTLALDVLEQDRTGGVWRWDFEDLRLRGVGLGLPQEVDKVMQTPGLWDAVSAGARLATDIGLECQVNLQGDCVEVSNWPDWRERLENIVLIGSGALRAYGATREAAGPGEEGAGPPMNVDEIAGVAERVAAILLDGIDEASVASAARLTGFSGFSGRTLRLGEETPMTEEWTMPYGAPPLLFEGSMTLESIDRAAGTAVVTRTMRLDGDRLQEVLTSVVQNLTPPIMAEVMRVAPESAQGQDMDPAMLAGIVTGVLSAFRIQYTEETTAIVDLSTGLVQSSETAVRSSVKTGDGTNMGVTDATISVTVTAGGPRRPRLTAGAEE